MAHSRIWKYVWELPVRLTHWVNFLCVTTFIATGLYIGNPYLHANDSTSYLMGYMRFMHFTAGYVFVCSIAVRTYWAFAGNRYASWRVVFPFFFADRRKDLVGALKFYALMSKKPPYSVGHTAMAGFAYWIIILVFLFQVGTGFAMMHLAAPGPFKMVMGGWILGVLDVQTIRLWHHLMTYAIVAFVFVQLYIGWWLDTVEHNGLMGSIFGGSKFIINPLQGLAVPKQLELLVVVPEVGYVQQEASFI